MLAAVTWPQVSSLAGTTNLTTWSQITTAACAFGIRVEQSIEGVMKQRHINDFYNIRHYLVTLKPRTRQ